MTIALFSSATDDSLIPDPSHVLQPQMMELNEDLSYEEYHVAVVDRQVRQLQIKHIPMVKVL